jgi:hypothetical protein
MTYREQIEKIVSGIKIVSKRSYEVEGKTQYVKNQTPFSNYGGDLKNFGSNQIADEHTERQNLVNHLISTIYSYYYCGIQSDKNGNKKPSKGEQQTFMDQLSKANTSKGGLDYNWKIYSVDPSGNAFVQKDGELRWLQPKTFQYLNPRQQQPQINTFVHIHKQRESRTIQPVFYHVFSDEIFPQEVELSRIYWNIKPESAPKLINVLSSTLNDLHIPFQFKCLNHPDLYVRSDAAVLYLHKKNVHVVSIVLKSILNELKDDLQEGIPMFTKKLFKGVGFAEDPGKGMSFGMSRSTVIADALVDAFLSEKENVLDHVLQKLEQKGFVIDRMHLNKHTELIPNFPLYD